MKEKLYNIVIELKKKKRKKKETVKERIPI